MKLSDIKVCTHCGRTYELGFYGTGKKYCSQECRRHRYKYDNKMLKRTYKVKDKDENS